MTQSKAMRVERTTYMRLLIGTLFTCLSLSACGPKQGPGPTREFVDDLSRTVAVPERVDRILTLAPNLTEVTFAAGAGDKLVAVTTADTYPPEILELPRVSALPLDFEAIVAQRPDVVLATDQVNATADAERLQELGIPTVFLSFSSFEDVFDGIRKVGRIAGTYERANEHAGLLESTVESLAEKTRDVAERPSVLVLVSDDPLFSFGAGSYVQDIVRLAGGRSITADIESEAPVLSDEFVLTRKPEVILGAFGEDYDSELITQKHETWSIVPAVRNQRIYSLNPDVLLRPGPRLVEGAFRAAMLLHPDLFGAETAAER